MRIGVVVSDRTSPNQSGFSFIASQDVFAGQFIEARTVDGLFLGLVTSVRISNPDYEAWETIHHVITKKPEVDFDMRNLEVYGQGMRIGEVNVLGTFNLESGKLDFTGRAVPPGSEVHTAEPSRLARMLSEDPEGLHVGTVIGNEEIKVSIPVKSLYHHLAVVGSTGSGKSYLGGVICEELAKRGLSVLVIDPHGEYAGLGVPSVDTSPMSKDPNDPPLKVTEFTPAKAFIEGTEELSLRLSQLSVDDLLHTMDLPGERQRILLLSSFEKFVEGVEAGQVSDDLAGLVSIVRQVGERGFGETVASTIIRLSKLNELGVLGTGFSAQRLVGKGTVTVVNVSGLDQASEDIMVGALLRVLFRERRKETVPPFILIVEEIHRYAPSTSTPTKTALASVVKEGRKFGIGVVALSQRPSDIDTAILTQCNTISILRLFDKADIERVRSRLGSLGELEASVQFFPAGRAVLSGLATRFPLVLQVRKRETGADWIRTRKIVDRGVEKMNLWEQVSIEPRTRSVRATRLMSPPASGED